MFTPFAKYIHYQAVVAEVLGKALEKTDKHKTRSRHQRTGLLVEETEWMVVKVAP